MPAESALAAPPLNTLPRRTALALPVLALLLIVVALVSVSTGAVALTLGEILRALAAALGLPVAVADHVRAVFIEIRLPRVLFATLAGAGLAVAGAVMQGLFRNPLADPSLIGVSSGAALAAASVILLGGADWMAGLALPAAAFAGGLAAACAAYRLASNAGHTSIAALLLAGIALSALAEAGIGLFTFLSNDAQLRTLSFWRLGSLGGASWASLAWIAPLVLMSLLVLVRLAPRLDALALGEASAAHLGVPVQRTKQTAVALTALVVGVLVAAAGIIWFVGLVAPHIARLALGPGHRLLLPASALLGASLTTCADLIARICVAPAELPLSVLTAFLGVPFFVVLLVREQRRGRT